MHRALKFSTRPIISAAVTAFGYSAIARRSDADAEVDISSVSVKQPTFGSSSNTRTKSVRDSRESKVNLSSLVLMSGSGHPELSKQISELIDVKLADIDLKRFADGEVSMQVNSAVRGKHVYIVQSCAPPVNENVLELLLMISCVRRAGARRVTAIIPYFGYKHHRRSTPVSTKHQSRFLTSGAMDFAKMLEVMEVDSVVAVDIQRPGQGQEACYFNARVPLECVVTTKMFVDRLNEHELDFQAPVVVVAPNAESIKKATKFQMGIQKHVLQNSMRKKGTGSVVAHAGVTLPESSLVKVAAFFAVESGTGYGSTLELLGDAKISGADVVIVDDVVETAQTISKITTTLREAGARNVYVCASHGMFTPDSLARINKSGISKVLVTDSLPLPTKNNEKIVTIPVAPLLAKVILAEHYRRKMNDDVNVTYEHG